MKIAVITEVPEAPDMGNLAAVIEIYFQTEQPSVENEFTGSYCALHEVDPNLAMIALLHLRQPVFFLGETFIIDEHEREVGGHMRKPSKWSVSYEVFDDIDMACLRSEEVTA